MQWLTQDHVLTQSYREALFQKNTHLNLGSCAVMTPISSSEGLKSMDRTVDRHEIAVCLETKGRTSYLNMIQKIKVKEKSYYICIYYTYIHTRCGQLSSANGRQQSQFLMYPPLI